MSSDIAKCPQGRQTHLLLKITKSKVLDICLTVSPFSYPSALMRLVDCVSGSTEIPQRHSGASQRASAKNRSAL